MKVKINLEQRTVRHWNGQKRAQFPFMTLKRGMDPFWWTFPLWDKNFKQQSMEDRAGKLQKKESKTCF